MNAISTESFRGCDVLHDRVFNGDAHTQPALRDIFGDSSLDHEITLARGRAKQRGCKVAVGHEEISEV